MSVRQFLSFSAVGTIGFLVDAGVLHLTMQSLGAGLYAGRIVSYLAAATVTWALNRRYTFRERRSTARSAEWGRFLAANSVGGVVNYSTYAALVTASPLAASHPVLGVAAGSVAGLLVNFTLSRLVVFRG